METRLEVLADASARIIAARSLEERLRLAAEAACDLVRAREAVVRLAAGPERPPPEAIARAGEGSAHRGPAPARLSVPLRGRDGAELGHIDVSGTDPFDAADEAILVRIARIASLAIENLRIVEAALADQRRFEAFATLGSEVLWETDAQHRYTWAVAKGTFSLRRDPKEYLGKTRWEVLGADPRDPLWAAHIADLEAHRPVRRFEYTAVLTDGKLHRLRINADPVFAADGTFAGYRGATLDVTDLRAAEHAARASEARFRDFAGVSSDWLWESDAAHRFTYFSPSRDHAKLNPKANALGKTRWEHAGADRADPKWQAHIADHDAHRPFKGFEYNFTLPDGSVGTFVVSGVPVFAEDGTFRGYRGTTSDITLQRKAEAAALESERKYRYIVETAHEGIWMVDLERRTIYANPRVAEMLGYTPAEMLGRPHWDFMAPADRAAAIEATRRRAGDGVERVERRYLRKDGSPIWVIVTSNIVEDPMSGQTALLGMVTDITDRKRAEAALKDSEERYRTIVETANEGVWAIDRDMRVAFANRRAAELLGYEHGEIVGRPLTDFVPDDLIPLAKQYWGERRAGKAGYFEARYRRRDGSDMWVLVSTATKLAADGSFVGVTSMFLDITDRKHAEEAASRAKRELDAILASTSDGVTAFDNAWRYTYVNAAGERIMGVEARDVVGKVGFDMFKIADDNVFRRCYLEAKRTNEPVWFTGYTDVFKGWHEIRAYPHAEGITIFFRDVTGVRQAHLDLAEGEQKLRAALADNQSILASISDGFVALDNVWRFTFINAAAERIWNRKAEEMLGKTILDTLNVDYSNPFQANYLESKRSGEPTFFTAYSDLFGLWLEVRGYPHPGGYTFFFHDVTDERRSQRRLLENRQRLEAAREMNERLFETSLDPICVTDSYGTFVEVNPGACKQFGYAKEEFIGNNASMFIVEEGLAATREAMRQARRSQSLHTFENKCRRKNGEIVPVNWSVAWSEREQKYFLIGRDMSEQVAAQERLNRSQRLEAIGQLTGGIAHDFNNLLTVIMGNSETLAEGLADRANLRRRAELSLEAARRAAELTSQLLAFARRQTLAPKAVEANKLVRDMHELVRRTLGAGIDIELVPDASLWPCKADSTQLETALLNLALNARDAMPGGGRLTISTANRTAAAGGERAAGELAPGDYVAISVADTGFGMTPDVLARAFEPFFTTKDIGKGSGLGLAMVYGFAKQSGGSVQIESAPGKGTKVTLYLPRAEEAAPARAPTALDGAPLPQGHETILVVEDDPAVRELVTAQLKGLGYRVLVAGNGSMARNILYGGEKVDLLFTDVMMPGGINGTQLAAEAEKELPGIRVLFTTGYSEAPSLSSARKGVALLRKPYKTRDLARTVREMLDAPA